MPIAGFVGDHPLIALIAVVAVIVLIAVVAFMTVGLRRMESEEPYPEPPESRRIRRKSMTWWPHWWYW